MPMAASSHLNLTLNGSPTTLAKIYASLRQNDYCSTQGSLQEIAACVFDPNGDGIIEDFELDLIPNHSGISSFVMASREELKLIAKAIHADLGSGFPQYVHSRASVTVLLRPSAPRLDRPRVLPDAGLQREPASLDASVRIIRDEYLVAEYYDGLEQIIKNLDETAFPAEIRQSLLTRIQDNQKKGYFIEMECHGTTSQFQADALDKSCDELGYPPPPMGIGEGGDENE